MAKTLQVCFVDKKRPIAFVILDVIYVCGKHSQSSLGAFPAKWLPQELRRPQIIRPDRQVIPAMPSRALTAWRLYGLMRCAPSITGQGETSWISARPKQLIGHRLSPPGKTKSPYPTFPKRKIIGHGLSMSTGHCRYLPGTLPCISGTRESDFLRWSRN